MFQKRLDFFRSIIYLGDLVLVAACWIAAYYLRFYFPIIPVTKGIPPLDLYLTLLGLVAAVFAVVFLVTGLYRRPWAGFSQYWWPIFRATTIGVVVSVTLTYFFRPYEFSRLVFLQFFVLINLAMALYRPLLAWAWSKLKPESSGEGVLIVGVEDLGRLVAQKIRSQPVLGLRIEGFLTHRQELVGEEVDGLPVLGLYSQIRGVMAEKDIQLVMIALPLSAHERILDVVNSIADEMVDIKVIPDLLRHISLRRSVEEYDGLPIIGLRGSPMEGWARVSKRACDFLGSLVGIIILGPLMLGLAALVKISSPGPVFYRQDRMGLDGRLFTMLKFRSMYQDAEKDCGPVWACKDDPRRTKVGAFMRRTNLDELPQLFNVLKGEMSLVGPRPERPEFITDFRLKVPRYMWRHKVKAGLTGWAQINGWRGNTSLEPRIAHDLYYIENWSLGLDFKIMLLTLFKGFSPNAY
ncbi:MAG: undecaprenyl-phosphate glucose phosphotransferase [Desulfarculaceae bacterium]|jgi:Undecaprenyl-phosphate glucose phosphotransferase